MGCRGISSIPSLERVYSVGGNALRRENNEKQHMIVTWPSAECKFSRDSERRDLGRVGSRKKLSRKR